MRNETGEQPPEIQHEAEELIVKAANAATQMVADEQKKEDSRIGKSWRQWVHQSLEGSASAAHSYTREPQQWRPTTGSFGTAESLLTQCAF